jgi:preprotein translocase subunit SecF
VIVVLPSPVEVAGYLAGHPWLVVVIVLVAIVVWPAVWSRRPERRCAAAAVLATLVDGVVAVAQLGVTTVLGAWPGRAATA